MQPASPAPPREAQMLCWLASGELDCVFLEDYKEPIGIAQSCTPLGGPNALLASIVLGDYITRRFVSEPYAIWNPISQSVVRFHTCLNSFGTVSGALDCVFLEEYGGTPMKSPSPAPPLGRPKSIAG